MGDLLGTSASNSADLVLILELGIAITLALGMFVVRRGNVRLHAYLQSSMVLVNIPIVLIWMAPHYWTNV